MQDSEPSNERCAGVKARLGQWRECAENTVREEPVKAAGYAFLGGIVVAIFPVGRILGGVLRVALALLRPALVILGIVKCFEELDRRGGRAD